MNKELEALERIGNITLYQRNLATKKNKYVDLKDSDYDGEYNLIKQALTPPTEEELCKAYNEEFEYEYDGGTEYFIFQRAKTPPEPIPFTKWNRESFYKYNVCCASLISF